MAKTDIMGLLTGVSSQGIDPMAQLSPAQQRMEFGARRARGLSGAVRGLLGGEAPIQEQIQAKMSEGILGFETKPLEEQKRLIKALQLTGQTALAGQLSQQMVENEKIRQEQLKKEQSDLKATSLASALENAGHKDLAKQVRLGDADAYKRGLELISPEQGQTSIEEIVDPTTGVTHKVLLSADGTILRNIGVSEVPKLKSVTLPNGKIVWENEATGTRGEPQDTEEAAEQDRQRIEKLYSDLAGVDNVLSTVAEAKAIVQDDGLVSATGTFYTLASMPFPSDARKLQSKITTLQSTLAFDRLQKMRDESKTGGALGQVSNIELQLLQAALTALDPVVGEEEFIKQLEKVQKHYTNFKKALLGEPLDIDWSRPEYKGKTTVVDGIRYLVDPTDPTKVFAVGKEK